MYYKRILTFMFPVLYSPNETVYFLGFFTSWIRIGIQEAYLYANPNPKHCYFCTENFACYNIQMCRFQCVDTYCISLSFSALYRDKASRDLKEAYAALKRKYEGVFARMARQQNIDQMASAWYFVAYNQNRQHKARPFLSFPWVISTWLCRIKNKSR